jgi:hypothetical protein
MKANRKLTMALVVIGLNVMYIAPAAADFFGPPPPGDPSAYTGPFIGDTRNLEGTPLPNEGAFEGGLTGTEVDAGADNSVPVDQQILLQTFVIPSNTKPSPMFHARPFTQPLLRFEEFGPETLDPLAPPPADGFPIPAVGPLPEQDPLDVARSNPSGVDLENFLAQSGIAPFPTEFSNTTDLNPWQTQIESFLGRSLNTPPAEGRPPGQGWAHQRWTEFQPEVFFKTAQAGSRVNNGFRDPKQMHGECR